MTGNGVCGASSCRTGRRLGLGAVSRPRASFSRGRATPARAEAAPRNSSASPLPAPAGAAPQLSGDAPLEAAYPAVHAAKHGDALISILPFRSTSKPVLDAERAAGLQEKGGVPPPPSWPSAAARRGLYSDVPVERVRLGGHRADRSLHTESSLYIACQPCTAPPQPRVPPPFSTHPPTHSQTPIHRLMPCTHGWRAGCLPGCMAASTAMAQVGRFIIASGCVGEPADSVSPALMPPCPPYRHVWGGSRRV
jgi:hypothetical protein